jgi:hypothetical protein
MTASVVSGVISETAPTKVVLPTPKPPATTIFTEVIAASAASAAASLELPKSTEYPFKQVHIRAALFVINLVDPDQSIHRHIADEDTSNPEGHPEHRRDLRDRPPVAAEPENGLALGTEDGQVARLVVRSGDHGLNLKVIPRFGPPAGDRIGAHQRAPGAGLSRFGNERIPRRRSEAGGELKRVGLVTSPG